MASSPFLAKVRGDSKMEVTVSERTSAPVLVSTNSRLSYKFQRLREQLRTAILSGELQGRLPGERELARRYQANAKTINKALCDLSSEGLVIRHIGKGTFVCSPQTLAQQKKQFAYIAPRGCRSESYRGRMIDQIARDMAGNHCEMQTVSSYTSLRQSLADAARQEVEGCIFYPIEPLSNRADSSWDSHLLQVQRRQLFCVVVGDCSQSIRVNTVAPDHVDAGYRLSEYLFNQGCDEICVFLPSRDTHGVELFMSGCRAAAQRFQRTVQEKLIGAAGTNGTPASYPNGKSNGSSHPNQKSIGVIAVGNTVEAVHRLQHMGTVPKACPMVAFPEPGDSTPARLGMTAYEVSLERVSNWVARLAAEHRPGARPVEVAVPGSMCIRDGIAETSIPSRLNEAAV